MYSENLSIAYWWLWNSNDEIKLVYKILHIHIILGLSKYDCFTSKRMEIDSDLNRICTWFIAMCWIWW